MATIRRGVQTQAGAIAASRGLTDIVAGVQSSSSGLLYCMGCQAGWCEHIQSVINDRLDSKSIWSDFTFYDTSRILVPILPNDWYLFADTLIVPAGNDFEVKVSGGTGARIPDAYDVGMISRGDGRAQMRQMIIDWIRINIPPEKVAGSCTATSHGIGQEVRVQEDLRTDKRALLAHCWCIKWYAKCAICTQREGPGATAFDPKLISKV